MRCGLFITLYNSTAGAQQWCGEGLGRGEGHYLLVELCRLGKRELVTHPMTHLSETFIEGGSRNHASNFKSSFYKCDRKEDGRDIAIRTADGEVRGDMKQEPRGKVRLHAHQDFSSKLKIMSTEDALSIVKVITGSDRVAMTTVLSLDD